MKFTLAGGYYRLETAKSFLKNLKEPVECVFEHDPTNRVDPNAIKVICDGHHIGFVPRGTSICVDVPGKVIPTLDFYSRYQPYIEYSV
jgi:hypothetical protein